MIGCFKKGLCKVLRIEAFKIVFSFSQADPFDRDMELFINGKDDAALGCSVKLCQDDAWLTAFCPVVASRTRSV